MRSTPTAASMVSLVGSDASASAPILTPTFPTVQDSKSLQSSMNLNRQSANHSYFDSLLRILPSNAQKKYTELIQQ